MEAKKQLIEQASKVDISLVGNGLDSMALSKSLHLKTALLLGEGRFFLPAALTASAVGNWCGEGIGLISRVLVCSMKEKVSFCSLRDTLNSGCSQRHKI